MQQFSGSLFIDSILLIKFDLPVEYFGSLLSWVVDHIAYHLYYQNNYLLCHGVYEYLTDYLLSVNLQILPVQE